MGPRTESAEDPHDDGQGDEGMEKQSAGHADEEKGKRPERRAAAFLHGAGDEREDAVGRDAHDGMGDGQHDVVGILPESLERLAAAVGQASAEKSEEQGEENDGEHFAVVGGGGEDVDRNGASDDVGQVTG